MTTIQHNPDDTVALTVSKEQFELLKQALTDGAAHAHDAMWYWIQSDHPTRETERNNWRKCEIAYEALRDEWWVLEHPEESEAEQP